MSRPWGPYSPYRHFHHATYLSVYHPTCQLVTIISSYIRLSSYTSIYTFYHPTYLSVYHLIHLFINCCIILYIYPCLSSYTSIRVYQSIHMFISSSYTSIYQYTYFYQTTYIIDHLIHPFINYHLYINSSLNPKFNHHRSIDRWLGLYRHCRVGESGTQPPNPLLGFQHVWDAFGESQTVSSRLGDQVTFRPGSQPVGH